jgi:hypothetical protein
MVLMPIVDIGNSKQLEFGYGDIQVSPALLKTDEIIGAVCFFNQEPRQIGAIKDHSPNEERTIEETPVRMIFEKVESIDVVIWALEEAKKYMLNKKISTR